MSNSISIKSKDIIITDPCYIAKSKDWGSIFDWESYKIKSPEFTNYIWTYTGQGDGTWMVLEPTEILNRVETEKFITGYNEALKNFNLGNIDSICKLQDYMKSFNYLGRFGVDSGTFGVFYLQEVLEYNPDFLRDHGIWLYTIVRDFTGSVMLQFEDSGFNILGIGNKTFCSL